MIRIILLLPTLAVLCLAGTTGAAAHGMSAADQKAMLEAGYGLYGWLGAKHMLTGYDHLLFIFGVVFFLRGMRDILTYITAFTLGHSITLIFATLTGILRSGGTRRSISSREAASKAGGWYSR